MRFSAVFNRDGGTFRSLDMEDFCRRARRIFFGRGHDFDCRIVAGGELERALEEAAGRRGHVLLAGGGDGTISAAAAAAFRHGTPLGVVPAGTMNLFARSLGLPLDLDAALRAIAEGELASADIATANGRPFVHQFSMGIHSRLVRIREGLVYRSRFGKLLASLRAVAKAVIDPPLFAVEVQTPGGTERRLASAVTVANNIFAEGHFPHAESLDAGLLGLYVAAPMSSWTMARLCAGVLVGHWKHYPELTEEAVRAVTLRFPRRNSSAMAVLDGELMRLPREVSLRVHPGGLTVVRPRALALEAA